MKGVKLMQIIKPSVEILTYINGTEVLQAIEAAGRTCYKSEDKITADSCKKFVRNIIQRGHESVLEHYTISVRFICDRGVSHEIVRHRLAAYSQESSRYCNYSKDKFGSEITVIQPCFFEPNGRKYYAWKRSCEEAEAAYFDLLDAGATPQEARSVLPTSLKTELVMTANLREWRYFFKMRTSLAAHPQMRELTIPLLEGFKTLLPEVFDDIEVEK